MAKICGWCGEKIKFSDMEYEWRGTTNTDGAWVCGKCLKEIALAQKGIICFEEITCGKTDTKLLEYYINGHKKTERNNTSQYESTKQDHQRLKERQKLKEEAQLTNPLYDDIHQIAGDLRFIKNYLVFSIVVSIILGLILLFSML